MARIFLGIDIAKSTFEAALIRESAPLLLEQRKFTNDPQGFEQLSTWLTARNATASLVHACLEATGAYGQDIAAYLHQQGHRVSLVNPLRTKAFAQSQLVRNKTDRLDAAGIARFCQSQDPPAWTPPEPAQRELQALCRHREALLLTLQQQKNRLEVEKSGRVRDSLQALITYLEQEVEQLQRQVKNHIIENADLKRQKDLLVSIPGISDLTAASLLAEIGSFCSFDSARQVAAFAGLTPRQHCSGSSVRGKPRLSKIGNARIRKALYFPAMVALRFNPVLQELSKRLKARGKCPMVIIGAAMRKLVHLAYGVLKTGRPFDPNHARAA